MKHNILAPSVGESVQELSLLKWTKQTGSKVQKGEVLLEVESEKATVEIVAEASGILTISKPAGETVRVGAVLGVIEDETAQAQTQVQEQVQLQTQPQASLGPSASPTPISTPSSSARLSPSVRKLVLERGLSPSSLALGTGSGKGGRWTKDDVLGLSTVPTGVAAERGERREKMSRIRARIAERLVQAQRTAAILTTFNEVDMSSIQELRQKNKEAFQAKYGVSLGFLSFFTRACVLALRAFPSVNAFLEGDEIVYHDYVDMGIAVGTNRGLVVPVIRNAQNLSFGEIEMEIARLARKARDGKLSIPEMSGGTLTISNGGVYGSLLSTPILNPPQTAILGMHKIQDRPVVIQNALAIRPMMYLALSYDHRLIDGKEAVSFLVSLKELLEQPQKLNLDFLNEASMT
jgi:2-oxoglutarate dehydrogenase E2 component (dihydrolipoamide succinyltransferase)